MPTLAARFRDSESPLSLPHVVIKFAPTPSSPSHGHVPNHPQSALMINARFCICALLPLYRHRRGISEGVTYAQAPPTVEYCAGRSPPSESVCCAARRRLAVPEPRQIFRNKWGICADCEEVGRLRPLVGRTRPNQESGCRMRVLFCSRMSVYLFIISLNQRSSAVQYLVQSAETVEHLWYSPLSGILSTPISPDGPLRDPRLMGGRFPQMLTLCSSVPSSRRRHGLRRRTYPRLQVPPRAFPVLVPHRVPHPRAMHPVPCAAGLLSPFQPPYLSRPIRVGSCVFENS